MWQAHDQCRGTSSLHRRWTLALDMAQKVLFLRDTLGCDLKLEPLELDLFTLGNMSPVAEPNVDSFDGVGVWLPTIRFVIPRLHSAADRG